MNKKHYKVLITGWSTVLVISAESEEEALEFATDSCNFGDFEMDEARIEQVVDEDEIDDVRSDVNCVAEDPDAEAGDES